MNTTWPHKKLEEVLVLNRSGYWGDDAASATRPIPVKVIRNADITKHNSIKGSASRYFSAKEATNAELQIGDIAMSSSGDVGKAWLVNEAGYSASNFIRIFRPDSKMVLPSFLKYVLESAEGQSALASSTAGTTIQNLQKTFYSTLAVPLPPLPEQQRIVRLLDEAFEGIAIARANAEKNLQNARALFENYRAVVLDQGKNNWRVQQLGELCEIFNGSTPSKANSAYWAEGTIPWFTIVDLREQGSEISQTIARITALALDETSVKMLPKDAVLLCCTASVGEVAIARIPLTTNQQFNGLVVKDKEKLDPNFLFHYATTLQPKLLSLSGKTTIDFIPISRLREVNVPIPPLADQHNIVARLNQIKTATSQATGIYGKKVASLVAFKESLLRHAFSGDQSTT